MAHFQMCFEVNGSLKLLREANMQILTIHAIFNNCSSTYDFVKINLQ